MVGVCASPSAVYIVKVSMRSVSPASAAPAHHPCVASSTLRSTAVVPLESLMEFSVALATFCFVPPCFRNCRHHNYVFHLFPDVDNLYYVHLSSVGLVLFKNWSYSY